MNRTEFIAELAKRAGITKKEAENIVILFGDIIVEQAEKGNSVALRNFGTFKVTHFQARRGINPQNLELIDIPPKKALRFVASGKVKERIQNSSK
jgi:DNA-binding protein HU-beta